MLSKHFTLTQTAARKSQAQMDEECFITLERGYQIPGVSIAAQWFLLVNVNFFSFCCTCLFIFPHCSFHNENSYLYPYNSGEGLYMVDETPDISILAAISSDGQCLALMASFLWAFSGPKPSVWTRALGSGQTGRAVFPGHEVQNSSGPFWYNTASLKGRLGGLARPQANGCSSEATERALWLRRWFWRDPPTQCPLLFIYTQQKQKSLLQSAVAHTRTHRHIQKDCLCSSSISSH